MEGLGCTLTPAPDVRPWQLVQTRKDAMAGDLKSRPARREREAAEASVHGLDGR